MISFLPGRSIVAILALMVSSIPSTVCFLSTSFPSPEVYRQNSYRNYASSPWYFDILERRHRPFRRGLAQSTTGSSDDLHVSTHRPAKMPSFKNFLKKALNVNRILFFFYSAVGMVLVPKCVCRGATAGAATAPIILATVWLGFVLAISWMEAWLKFRAPFLPKPLALDVGRTIFPALNSVELAMCVSLWFNAFQSRTVTGTNGAWPLLTIPTLILLLDVAFLTPKLGLRGKQMVLEYVTAHPEASKIPMDSLLIKNLKEELHGTSTKEKDKWHVVYVVLEAIKILGLSMIVQKATVM